MEGFGSGIKGGRLWISNGHFQSRGFVISGLYFWEVLKFSFKFFSFIITDLFDWIKFCNNKCGVNTCDFDSLISLYPYVLYILF